MKLLQNPKINLEMRLNFVKISLYCKMINPKLRYMKFRNIIRLKCFAFVGPQLIFFVASLHRNLDLSTY